MDDRKTLRGFIFLVRLGQVFFCAALAIGAVVFVLSALDNQAAADAQKRVAVK